jgi:hypothetical protein
MKKTIILTIMALTANLCTNAQQRQQVTQSEILIIAQRLLADSSEQSERTIQNIQVAEKREVEELTLHLIELQKQIDELKTNKEE